MLRRALSNLPHRAPSVGVAAAAALVLTCAREAGAQLTGELGAHDPSTVVKDGERYYYFATGQGIAARSSSNKVAWSGGPSVFGAPPAWTTQAVPSFTGHFWAPDVAYFNGQYHLYYSVSSWGTIDSAIGLATSPSLVNPTWTDQGKVVQSDAAWEAGPNTDTTAYNAIDPSILVDSNGSVWMAFGSYSSGILVTQLNPATGKRLNTSTLNATQVANNAPGGGWGSTIEAAALARRDNYYYLFVNYGGCCAGVDSTYEIRVGRSTSPTGPFVDRNGVDMRNGGGTLFLDDDGKMIGPGHFELHSDGGQDQFSYHYYDGNRNGAPTFGLRNLYWTADAWPSYAAVNPNWTGATGGWSNALNWSGGALPDGAGHVANFGPVAANRVVSLDGSGRTVATLNFSSNASYQIGTTGHVMTLDATVAGDSATINVSAGNHVIAAPISAIDPLAVNVTPPASTLTLSGAGSAPALTKYGRGTLLLGGTNTYGGSVHVRWGTLDVVGSVTAGQFSSVGVNANETATMTVRGTGSFTANADLNVGDTGDGNTPATGILNLRDNASVTVNAAGGFFVGSGFFNNTRADGTVNQSGGTLTANGNFDGAFIIGGRNSSRPTGTYNLSGGTVNANTNVRIGGRGFGTINQSGGTFNASGHVALGRFNGAIGVWNVTGGTINHNNAATLFIVGEQGTGTLNVSGSGEVITNGSLRLGLNNSGGGTVNLDGGAITTPLVARGTGAATFNFNGGTLRAGASSAAFMQGLTSAYVKAGGARVDTQSFNVTIAQPLLHDPSLGSTLDGGLTKTGAGTLTLSGVHSYTGPTTASEGKLVLGQSLTASSSLSATGGAVVELASNGTGNRVIRTGAVATTGGGRIDVKDNKLVVVKGEVGSWNGSAYTGVTRLIESGRNQGTWSGSGIVTSMPGALNDYTTLAVATADEVGRVGETFGGVVINSGDVLVAYTYAGDANLDGVINIDDYGQIDFNVGLSGAVFGYFNGDFNYDGLINIDDYGIIDFNVGIQGPPLSMNGDALVLADASAVPEPSSALLAALGGTLCARRRRRVPGGDQRSG